MVPFRRGSPLGKKRSVMACSSDASRSLPAVGRDQTVQLGVVGLVRISSPDAFARPGRTPALRVGRVTRGDLGHAVGGGPAHQGGEGLRLPLLAHFPDACVGRARDADGLVGERKQQIEGGARLLCLEAVVEEHGRERQHHLAEDVVLLVDGGAVADAHRAVAVDSRASWRRMCSSRSRVAVDAVERGQREVGRAAGDVEQVVHELLALLEVAEQAERVEHVVGVAQPAVAVVPVAAAALVPRESTW